MLLFLISIVHKSACPHVHSVTLVSLSNVGFNLNLFNEYFLVKYCVNRIFTSYKDFKSHYVGLTYVPTSYGDMDEKLKLSHHNIQNFALLQTNSNKKSGK